MNASLRISDLCVDAASQVLLEVTNLHFDNAPVWAVVGRSGAGKSVLLKSALGLMPARSGRVEFHHQGTTICAHAGDAPSFAPLRHHVAFVHQDPALMDDLTVSENISFAISRRPGSPSSTIGHQVQFWLERLGIAAVADQTPAHLPPGQQRKVAICRALMLSPSLLIVDEATTGLDPLAAAEIIRSLQELAVAGTTLILISHDVRCLRAFSPHLVWVDDGRVRYQGKFPQRESDVPSGFMPLLYGVQAAGPAPSEERS